LTTLKAHESRKMEQIEQETPDGRHWFIRGYPVLNKQGEVICLVAFGQDITDQKAAELFGKPFSFKGLAGRIRETLDKEASAG